MSASISARAPLAIKTAWMAATSSSSRSGEPTRSSRAASAPSPAGGRSRAAASACPRAGRRPPACRCGRRRRTRRGCRRGAGTPRRAGRRRREGRQRARRGGRRARRRGAAAARSCTCPTCSGRCGGRWPGRCRPAAVPSTSRYWPTFSSIRSSLQTGRPRPVRRSCSRSANTEARSPTRMATPSPKRRDSPRHVAAWWVPRTRRAPSVRPVG